MNAFVIQGDYIEENEDDVFWSNEDGWVDFDSATIFKNSELNMPIGAKFIAYLNKEKKIIEREALTAPIEFANLRK